MIGTLAFIVGFVLLGLAVVFLAMRGGPRGAREALHTQSRAGSRAAVWAMALTSLALIVVVPLLIITDNEDSQAKSGPGGVELTANEADGRKLFVKNCSTCHTLNGAKAVGKVGPNLDTMRPPASLTLDAIATGRARGQGQMPAELLDGEEAKHVAEFVAKVAGR